MCRTAIAKLALLALAVSAAGATRPARAEILYTLKDLGTLPGAEPPYSQGFAVNASGQVAGASLVVPVPGNSLTHAFLSGPGGGPLQDLGTLPGGGISFGYGVNASGQVTGQARTAGGAYHAFLSGAGGGPLQDLGTLPSGNGSQGFGVNDSGQVAGSSTIAGNTASRAFLSGPDGGPLKDLGTLPGYTDSYGYGVNTSGQVTGRSGDRFTAHAFLSGPGGGPLQDLGTLPGGNFSEGLAVNASGQVVGDAGPLGGRHAFLYSGGQMFDLNDLIAPGSGFTLQYASGISDTGYITGWGEGADRQQHAFLLIPAALVPEPSGLVLLGTGAVGLLGYRAWRRTRLRA
jgi:probable HAF family extracellular repeat protein